MPVEILKAKVTTTAPDREGDARFEATVLVRNASEDLWEHLELEVRIEDAQGAALLTDTDQHVADLPPGEAAAMGTETWVHLGDAVPARACCTLRLQRTERVTAPALLQR